MARKTSEEIEMIKKKNNVSDIYSWSKYNTYRNSKYEYFLKYILKEKQDREDGIYGISGNAAHNIMEEFYKSEIEYKKMIELYEEALFNFNLAELKYDRSDEEKNKKIAKKYEACLRHFFQSHQIIEGKNIIEQFITIWVDNFLFQGYIDFLNKKDDCYIITDWKTSTIYSGQKINKEKGQLVLYAEALRQKRVPLEKIKIRWNFLKYVAVQKQLVSGKIAISNIERNQIGEKLKASAKTWLKKSSLQLDELEIEDYLSQMVITNDIKCLPNDVKNKFKINDCYVYIPYNLEEINLLKEKIKKTIVEIKTKECEYNKTKDEKIWWEDVTERQSYYFANLCGYSRKLHKPYNEYLEHREMFLNNNKKEKNEKEEDLSWLNDL